MISKIFYIWSSNPELISKSNNQSVSQDRKVQKILTDCHQNHNHIFHRQEHSRQRRNNSEDDKAL